jgi:MFS family permease
LLNPSTAFQILYAKFYTFFNVKWVFLTALCVFEIGSLLCGVAPSSNALIVGRAIAGLGSSGLYSGAATAIAAAAPIRLRPLLTGLLGGLFGFSSIIGPLVSPF